MDGSESKYGMTRDQIRKSLVDLNSSRTCAVFAARCALRVYPLCVSNDDGWSLTRDSIWHAQGVLAAILSGFLSATADADDRAYIFNAARNASFRAHSYALGRHALAVIDPALVAKEVAYAAGHAAIAHSATVVDASIAAVDAVFAADRARIAAANQNGDLFYQIVVDLKLALAGTERLLFSPLWREVDSSVRKDWERLLTESRSFSLSANSFLDTLWHGEPDFKVMVAWLDLWYLRYKRLGESERSGELSDHTGLDSDPVSQSAQEPSSNTHQNESFEGPLKLAQAHLHDAQMESLATRDSLNSDRYVDALHQILSRRPDTRPFAIGLFGDWGRGKSSFVGFLKKKLLPEGQTVPQPEFLVAEFNAWRNEKATNHGAMLAQAVLDQLIADLSFRDRFLLAVNLHRLRSAGASAAVARDAKRIHLWLRSCLPFFSLIGGPLFLLLLLCWALSLSPSWQGILAFMLGVAGAAARLVTTFVYDNLTDWFKNENVRKIGSFFRLPDYSAHRGVLDEIQRTLAHLCELQLGKKNRLLLLVIDDLDRCSIDTVKEVLDAVRLVAEIPRVVTLVAIDSRMAYAAVEKHYQQFGDAGRAPELVARDYLAKVFQLSLRLPRVSNKEVAQLIDTELFPDGDLISEPSSPASDLPVRASVVEEHTDATEPLAQSDSEEGSSGERGIQVEDGKPGQESRSGAEIAVHQQVWRHERDAFNQLAVAYGFGNPRQLWRLHMAWRMLKFIAVPAAYQPEEVLPLLYLLFWREFVLQQDATQRSICEASLRAWHGSSSDFPASEVEVFDEAYPERKLVFPEGRSLDEAIYLVELVLLPISPKFAQERKNESVTPRTAHSEKPA